MYAQRTNIAQVETQSLHLYQSNAEIDLEVLYDEPVIKLNHSYVTSEPHEKIREYPFDINDLTEWLLVCINESGFPKLAYQPGGSTIGTFLHYFTQ